MAKPILSDKSNFVLSSHRGLSPTDVVQDCLEKIQSLLLICSKGFDFSVLPIASQHQYLSLLDDLAELALGHLMMYQEECGDDWFSN